MNEAGADVLDLGLAGTEEVYFATSHYGLGGGIAVTASHNPEDYNGMKLVAAESRPVSSDSGLNDIERIARTRACGDPAASKGKVEPLAHRDAYVEHLLKQVGLTDDTWDREAAGIVIKRDAIR